MYITVSLGAVKIQGAWIDDRHIQVFDYDGLTPKNRS